MSILNDLSSKFLKTANKQEMLATLNYLIQITDSAKKDAEQAGQKKPADILKVTLFSIQRTPSQISNPHMLLATVQQCWAWTQRAAHESQDGLGARIMTAEPTFLKALEQLQTMDATKDWPAPVDSGAVATTTAPHDNAATNVQAPVKPSQSAITDTMIRATKQLIQQAPGFYGKEQSKAYDTFVNSVNYFHDTVVPKNISYLSSGDPRRAVLEDLGNQLSTIKVNLSAGF